MTNYVCSKCNYNFSKDVAPPRCPYCSREGTIHPVKSAQELINDTLAEGDKYE